MPVPATELTIRSDDGAETSNAVADADAVTTERPPVCCIHPELAVTSPDTVIPLLATMSPLATRKPLAIVTALLVATCGRAQATKFPQSAVQQFKWRKTV